MENARRNPFPVYNVTGTKVIGWKFYDETWAETPLLYPTQAKALKAMLAYIHFLNHGPTLWQQIWWPVRYTFWPLVLKFVRA